MTEDVLSVVAFGILMLIYVVHPGLGVLALTLGYAYTAHRYYRRHVRAEH